MLIRRNIATLALTTLMLAAFAAPSLAGPPPRIDLRGDGVGSYVLDDAGTAHLTGTVTGTPFDGPYSATLAADDGSLPDPGLCEPASATLHVSGPRRKHMLLEATGEVCGKWVQDPYVVTHRFTGRYVVTDTSERRLRGTDGWMGQLLATEGRANVEAIDT